MKQLMGNLPITLDERGLVIIEDESLLSLVSGGELAPAPAPAPSNFCNSGNIVCPGTGNAGCVPKPPPPKPQIT